MSDYVFASIASLQAAVGSLQAQVHSLHARISGKADVTAIDGLTSCVNKREDTDLLIDASQAVQPLRMGKVVFHGETARQIRAAQTVLRQAGAGQLEVVKRANELGDPFVVIDGQVFISKATVESAAVGPGPYSVKVALSNDGRFYVAGVGIDASIAASELKLGPSLENDVRRLLREELQPGGILHHH